MTRRISWISWTQYHKVSFNFNSQHPHPPISSCSSVSSYLTSLMDVIAEQVSSANFLTSANITWTNAFIAPWKKMLFSRSSRFGRVSYCLQSRQHLPLSTLQSKSRAVHFRAVCQVVTASGSISWLRISTHTSSSTNDPPQLTLIVWDRESVVFGRIEVSLPQTDLWCITVYIRKRSGIQHGLYLK